MRRYVVALTGLLALAGVLVVAVPATAQDSITRTITGQAAQKITMAVAGFAPYRANNEDLGQVVSPT